jgi:hypothetical protein
MMTFGGGLDRRELGKQKAKKKRKIHFCLARGQTGSDSSKQKLFHQ